MQTLCIKDWAVWIPADIDLAEWAENNPALADDGSTPKVAAVPPAMRRRLDRLGKISLSVASDLVERNGYMPSVFCSRHGEIQTTIQMLKDLIWNNDISPTRFSLSVHNAISGIFTIANKSELPVTSITAGRQDLTSCFYEAYGQLKEAKSDNVLCVIYDEPIPDEYQKYCPVPRYPYAVGFVLSLDQGIKCSFSHFEELSSDCIENDGKIGKEVMALEFIKAIILQKESVEFVTDNSCGKQVWRVTLENY